MQKLFRFLGLLCFIFLFFTANVHAGDPGNEFNEQCQLPAPTNVTLDYAGPHSARISWKPVSGALAYQTELTDITSGTTLTEIKNDTFAEYFSPTIQPGHVYLFKVYSICQNGIAGKEFGALKFTSPIIIIVDIVERKGTPTQQVMPGTHHFPPNTPSDGSCQMNFDIVYTNSFGIQSRYEFLTYPNVSGVSINLDQHRLVNTIVTPESIPGMPSSAAASLLVRSNAEQQIARVSAITNQDYPPATHIQLLTNGARIYKNFICQGQGLGGNDMPLGFTALSQQPSHLEGQADSETNPIEITNDRTEAPTTAPDFQVYPNPVADQLWVEFNLPQEAQVRVQLLDMAGRAVQGVGVAPAAFAEGTHLLGFNVSQLPSGVYTLLFQSGDQSFVRRIVK